MYFESTLASIIKKYEKKYKFLPTPDAQSVAFSGMGIICLDVYRWKHPDLFFIFSVLHEIGHCETYKAKQSKVMREYLATQWAIVEFNKMKLHLQEYEMNAWQDYIYSFSKAKDKTKYKLDWKRKE